MRLWQFPYSTNVERVALALAHKGLDAEPAVVDPADRSGVRALSGQDLVPVLQDGDQVISGSLAIVAHLEERLPEPALWPADPARRAEVDLFLDWFDRLWLGCARAQSRPPNRIADGVPEPWDAAELRASLDIFEALLTDRAYLFGAFGVADVATFPFLKYAWLHDPADDEAFHLVLAEHLALDPKHARLRAWIEEMDTRPRAGLATAEEANISARFGS